ncbi:unnamed protein product [Ophioblennius macclurei]
MTSEEYQFFITIKKPASSPRINVGCICYSLKHNRDHQLYTRRQKVYYMNYQKTVNYDLDVTTVEELSQQEACFLLALPDDGERLKWFEERKALQSAEVLTEGASVIVKENGNLLRGIIRYVGPKDHYNYPVNATYFGVELQGADRGKGNSDGWFGTHQRFSCKRKCAVFVPFSAIWAEGPGFSLPSEQQPESEELSPGDRVTYFVNNECRHGMVVTVQDEAGQPMVKISTDVDESGNRGGEIRVPLDKVAKGEVPTEPQRIEVDTTLEDMAAAPHGSLSVDSLVEVTAQSGNLYGIIRWKGKLPDRKEIFVGLELEEDKGTSDGTMKQTRYFTCPKQRALFVKLTSCRPDSRFQSLLGNFSEKMPELEERGDDMANSSGELEIADPISTEQIDELLIGQMKGIQGHCNSCYMDAALFSLFSCSPVLDPLLFKEPAPKNTPFQRMLLHKIVNPLRSKGFVHGRHIMELRQQLQKLGCSHSFTFDEKDPEEFLTVIMQQILALDPLLKLSVGGKMQESYCYQIFLDQNHSLVLPTVQQLLEHSFHNAALKLAEVPSCLILQMPRFGKKFKMFDKILPSLELDITDLLSEGPQQCVLCGDLALEECTDCFKDPLFNSTGFKVFCRDCSTKVHSHPLRKSHKPARLDIPAEYTNCGSPRGLTRDKLKLFAVLCIETSHYVSFVKHGPNSDDWIFFDSMADRHGESDGYNIPEVKACPEVGTYLDMSPAELANQVPRDMKGEAKRLFCDAYMYLYQSTSMCLYR